MKNHEILPIGSEPLPQVNEALDHHARRGKGRDPNFYYGSGRGRGRGCGLGCDYGKIKKENTKRPLT